MRSRIRQVATGRFGVDAEYLVNADEIQIKMAQGAKPGEGGQLMSAKVTAEIARLRYCRPGIDLISPPPHHDIYSIEDLKQLIYDLRAVNPAAKISVKLCAVTGIGTIAAGVVKAGADIIEIDGFEGSTGASPRSSLEHAGLPTELGLREMHLALTALGLRDLVKLRAGGGIKTETDAIKYMLLGADQVTIATSLMIAQGCVHCNLCHTGTCPTLIAGTINERAVSPGSVQSVKNFLLAFGQGVAELAARWARAIRRTGGPRRPAAPPRRTPRIARNLKDAYGFAPRRLLDRIERMDMTMFLRDVTISADDTCGTGRSAIDNLDHSIRMLMEADEDLLRCIDDGRSVQRRYKVHSSNWVDFAVGVAGRIARKWGRDRWPTGARPTGHRGNQRPTFSRLHPRDQRLLLLCRLLVQLRIAQRGHTYAIVDEVDSILVDEARTPLIISGPSEVSVDLYYKVDAIIPRLKQGKEIEDKHGNKEVTGDYLVDEKGQTASLTDEGMATAEKLLSVTNLYDLSNIEILHAVNQALRAHSLFRRDKEYVVKDGEVDDRRRVHRPPDAGPAVVRRASPGGRGQGKGQDSSGEPDSGHDHAAELLPDVRQAGRDDRYGRDRGRGVREDLRPRRCRWFPPTNR